MKRKTLEVDIDVELDINGDKPKAKSEIDVQTGDYILDHLLTSMMFYMGIKADIKAKGDLKHHLWEDIGITIGKEIKDKIENKRIARFGNAIIPMDDALILVSIDISRSYMNFEADVYEKEKGFEITLVREFIKSLSRNINATIHVKQLSGVNSHHIIEAVFKGLGVALGKAISESDRVESTKGVL